MLKTAAMHTIDEGMLNHAVYDSEQMGEIDALCAPLISTDELMENAGWAVAHAIYQNFSVANVLVLCGPGNNGGDGFVTARYLHEAGWPVKVAYLKPPKAGSLSEKMCRLFRGPIVPFTQNEVARSTLVVDALFGAGLSRDIGPSISDVLSKARKVVAIDVPTGVDGSTGKIRGYAPRADLTVTFCRLKPGHLLYPGKSHIGKIVLADIDTPIEVLKKKKATIFHNDPALWPLPEMTAQSNKYSRGVVTVCAGHSMPGASLLASSAARMAGAGLVTLMKPKENKLTGFTLPPGLIVSDAPISSLLCDKRKKTWICGPGLVSSEVRSYLPDLIEAQCRIVADAGVFTAYAGMPEKLEGVSVITPHEGEFRRLFNVEGELLPEKVIEAARITKAVTILKGASTLIAAPSGELCINTHATPALATAGSGDTLSGIIAAFLANGLPPWESACAGVWIHGEVGREAGDWPVAETLDRFIGRARVRATSYQRKLSSLLEEGRCSLVSKKMLDNVNSAFSCS